VGRTPNGKKIAADKAGVAVTDRAFIHVDIQTRSNVPHNFAIGDIVGQPVLAHKAVHEAHVAVEVIAGELQGNKELAAAALNARAIANGCDEGMTKLLFDDSHKAPSTARSLAAA
jgi:dihydrolipoamide dehydrogenase